MVCSVVSLTPLLLHPRLWGPNYLELVWNHLRGSKRVSLHFYPSAGGFKCRHKKSFKIRKINKTENNNNNRGTILRPSAGFTRREIMERCVDTFTEYVQEGRLEGPERNRTRHHCLGTLLKPLGYLSSGARVRAHCLC